MDGDGSVTTWLGRLRAGDLDASQRLWERYFRSLVGLARARLRGLPRRAADEEDVALSAFASFHRGVQAGRFPRLTDRADLWHLLVTLTARKAVSLRRHETCHKRGGGQTLDEAALAEYAATAEEALDLAHLIGRELSPEFAAQVAEEFRRLLDALPDDTLRTVALAKLEGYDANEIADRLGCVPRTVERKLRRIRHLWAGEASHE